MNRLPKYRSQIILILGIIVCLLVVANIVKYGHPLKENILQNKELIDAVTKFLAAIVLIAGAIASYYRFFRGRTFAARADLKIDVAVYETDQNFKLHVINLEVTNIGAVTIMGLEPKILVYLYGPNGEDTYTIDNWADPIQEKTSWHSDYVLDPQERSQFHASEHISQEIWAVTYIARVESQNKYIWKRVTTVSNKSSSDNSQRA